MLYSIRSLSIILLSLSFLIGTPSFAQKKKRKKDSDEKTDLKGDQKTDNEYLFIKGEGFFIQEKYAEALKCYEQAAEKSPHSAGIYFKISRTQFSLKHYDKSVESAKKAIELKDNEKEYYINYIEILLSQHKLRETETAFDAMFLNCKGVTEYHEQAARVYEEIAKGEASKVVVYNKTPHSNAQKTVAQAEENYKKYLLKSINEYDELEKAMGIDERVIAQKQQHYLKINDVNGALRESDKLIEAFPKNKDYIITKCEIYGYNNQYKEAILFLEKIIKEQPQEATYLVVISNFYSKVGRNQDAENALSKAFESTEFNLEQKTLLISQFLQQPTDSSLAVAEKLTNIIIRMYAEMPQPYSLAGDVAILKKEKEKARLYYLKSVSIDSSKALIWQQIIALDIDLNQHDSLISDAKKALKIFPENALIWFYKGVSYQMLKKDVLALQAFEAGIAFCGVNFELQEQYYAQMGDVYYNVKNKEKSFMSYEESLTINPNNVHVLNNYAYFLSIENQDLHKAKSMIKKVLRIHPGEATYIDTYAWVLFKLTEYEEAKKQLEFALTTTKDATIIEHYGDVLYQLGDVDKAVEQWKKAAESTESSELINKKITDRKFYEK